MPINFIPTYDVLYDKATRNVVIDVNLPLVTDYPNLKSVAYIKSRHEVILMMFKCRKCMMILFTK